VRSNDKERGSSKCPIVVSCTAALQMELTVDEQPADTDMKYEVRCTLLATLLESLREQPDRSKSSSTKLKGVVTSTNQMQCFDFRCK
jgi:hypothetical protein